MKVGFTGTQTGLSDPQIDLIVEVLAALEELTKMHHGDCIGADAQFYTIVRTLRPNATIIGHLPEDESKRAFCDNDVELTPRPYLERNKNIVAEADVMIACQKSRMKFSVREHGQQYGMHEKWVFRLLPFIPMVNTIMRIKAQQSLQRLKEMKAKKRKVLTFSQVNQETWTQCKIDCQMYGPEYIKMVDWVINETDGFHSRSDETFWFEDEKDAFKFILRWGKGNEQE